MYSLIIRFLAISRSTDFHITANATSAMMEDITGIFVKETDSVTGQILWELVHQNTPTLREKIYAFTQQYKSIQPSIQQLNSYFRDLKEHEYFICYPNDLVAEKDRLPGLDYLIALNHGRDYTQVTKETNAIFGQLLKSYQLYVYGERTRRKIGEHDKTKRVCRFCGKRSPEVSFKHVSHAVSESLGNKKIITNDECDQCNKRFDETIERDLIAYLDIYRNIFGIKGKNGVPVLIGENYRIENKGTIHIQHFLTEEEEKSPDHRGGPMLLRSRQKVTEQNLYKTLCKYALSVIPADLLSRFTTTLQWMRGEVHFDRLPFVALLTHPGTFKQEPQICVYLRSDDDTRLPYAVGEFQFTLLTFAFIIPGSSADTLDFTHPDDYDRFWQFFKHYSSTPGWRIFTLNGAVAKPFEMELRFHPSKQ